MQCSTLKSVECPELKNNWSFIIARHGIKTDPYTYRRWWLLCWRNIFTGSWWGDSPYNEDSMIEFISHEATHSWILPFAEIRNELIATYGGNLVMMMCVTKMRPKKELCSVLEWLPN